MSLNEMLVLKPSYELGWVNMVLRCPGPLEIGSTLWPVNFKQGLEDYLMKGEESKALGGWLG